MKKNFIGIAFMGGALMIALTGCTHVGPQAPIPSSSTAASQGTDSTSPSAGSAQSEAPSTNPTEGSEPSATPDDSYTSGPIDDKKVEDSLKKYVEDYTKYVSCEQGASCVGTAGSLTVDCNTATKPSKQAVLTGYTIEYSDTAKTNPTAINCSWFTPPTSGE
jgi:hypothetical protein